MSISYQDQNRNDTYIRVNRHHIVVEVSMYICAEKPIWKRVDGCHARCHIPNPPSVILIVPP